MLTPRILIVEDDDPIRTLLAAALRREALDVDTAPDGAAGLVLTNTYDYAVIILDLMMPRMSGFEFLDAFRAAGRRSVIFVVTAFDDAHFAGLDPAQVHAVVRKPFDVPQLVTIVREVAALWNGRAPAQQVTKPADDLGMRPPVN